MQLIHSRPLEKIGSQLPIFLTGFVLVCGLAVLLQQVGLPVAYMSQLMLIILFSIYFYSGITAATMSLDAYQNARRCISPFFNGQGLAAGMISMGVFVLLPGYIYANGVSSLDYFGGWLLAVVVMTVLIASAYNKSMATTLPAFIVPERDSRWARMAVMLIVITISALLLLANLIVIGDMGANIFSIKEDYAIVVACITIGSCLLLGGIQGMTMARIFAYVILVSALFAPLIWTSAVITGGLVPQFTFGAGAVAPLQEIGRELVQNDLLERGQDQTITSVLIQKDALLFFATMICIACGLGVMPHLVQHFVVVETPSIARRTGIWAFAFLLLVITAIPAVSAFVHLEIFTALAGLEVIELREDSEWLFQLSGSGNLPMISICGQIVSGYNDALNACGGSAQHVLQPADITLNPEFLLLGTASLHNLPVIMFILIGLGVMVALWSTADGLILVIANTLSNDFYRNIFRPRSPMSVRLFMTRFMLVVTLCCSAVAALVIDLDKILLLETGIALSAAALFPAMIVTIFSKSLSHKTALATMFTGFLAFAVLVSPQFYPPVTEHIMWDLMSPFLAGVIGLVTALLMSFILLFASRISFKPKVVENAPVSN